MDKSHVINNPIKFAYAGGFIPYKRDPRPFIEYILSLEIDFEFGYFSYTEKSVSNSLC
jgi:hypothetical protein